MLKILNRTDKDISENTKIMMKKLSSKDFKFNLQEILNILDCGVYKKNTIMYDEDKGNIFIYDEEGSGMIIDQERINKILIKLTDEAVKKSVECIKYANTLTYDELLKLLNMHSAK
jgi:hypothetical protein